MSLLSDLLARVKHREQKRDVPPMLREDIVRSLQRQRARRRWLLISMASLMTMAAGVLLALWVGTGRVPQLLSSQPMVQTMPPAPQVAVAPDASSPEIGQAGSTAVEQLDQGRSTVVAQTGAASPNAAGEPPKPTDAAGQPPTTSPATPDSQLLQSGVTMQEQKSTQGVVSTDQDHGRAGVTDPVRPLGPATAIRETPHGESTIARNSRQDQADSRVASAPRPGRATGGDATGGEEGAHPAQSPPAEVGRPVRQVGRGTVPDDDATRGRVAVADEAGQRVRSSLVEEAGGEGRGGNEAKRAVAGSSPEGMLVPVKTPRWDRDVYLYQASTSEAAGDLKQALASYQKVLAMEPKNFLIMNNVASILVRQGSNNEAIGYAERAIAVKPRYVPALINLSIAYLQQGNRSEGESSLRRALTIEPANRLVLKNLGILMEKQDRFEEARSVYGKLAQLGDAQGYLGMARIAEKQDQKAEAVKAYQGLLQLDGISPAERALAGDRITMLTQ